MSHHHHDHAHEHHAQRGAKNRRRLTWALLLAAGYMIAEFIGGLLTNSLALLADAGHMLSDVAGLSLSLFALKIAERPPTPKRTYGYYRAEILAALVNGGALIAISLFIAVEAFRRLADPPEVYGPGMLAIAFGGLVVNVIGLFLLHGGRTESLNIRGAWLHVLTDALGSVGAIIAGGLIWAFGWRWPDPVFSLLIVVLVLYSAWRLVAESVSVLMESVPHGIELDEVEQAMKEVPGVLSVHDLHIWTITSGMDSLSAHVVAADGYAHAPMLHTLRETLRERFGIDHLTIQIEPEDFEEIHPHY